MRHRDFCFWLQGAIELCGPKVLTEAQVTKVITHLDLVDKSQKDVKNRRPLPHSGFCRALRTIIADQARIGDAEFEVIRKLLNAEFIHIDKDTEGDQDEMNEIHGFDRPPGARC